MKHLQRILLSSGIVAFAIGAPSMLRHSNLRMNSTDSVPVGLYVSQTEPTSSFVGICLEATTLSPALAAGLELGRGECPDGRQPILKPIYRATLESPIRLDSQGFTFAGARMANTMPKPLSKTGKPLAHYAFGVYTSGMWAVSGYSPDSYDSRYFGPIAREDIRFYARPLLVF